MLSTSVPLLPLTPAGGSRVDLCACLRFLVLVCARDVLQEEASSYTFEGSTVTGKAGIAAALAAIPIPAGTKARIITTDIQNSPSAGAFVVLITAQVIMTPVRWQRLRRAQPIVRPASLMHPSLPVCFPPAGRQLPVRVPARPQGRR